LRDNIRLQTMTVCHKSILNMKLDI